MIFEVFSLFLTIGTHAFPGPNTQQPYDATKLKKRVKSLCLKCGTGLVKLTSFPRIYHGMKNAQGEKLNSEIRGRGGRGGGGGRSMLCISTSEGMLAHVFAWSKMIKKN